MRHLEDREDQIKVWSKKTQVPVPENVKAVLTLEDLSVVLWVFCSSHLCDSFTLRTCSTCCQHQRQQQNSHLKGRQVCQYATKRPKLRRNERQSYLRASLLDTDVQPSKGILSFVGLLLPHFYVSLPCEVPHFSALNLKLLQNVSLSLFLLLTQCVGLPHPARWPQDTILLKLRPLKKKSACESKIDNADKRSFSSIQPL